MARLTSMRPSGSNPDTHCGHDTAPSTVCEQAPRLLAAAMHGHGPPRRTEWQCAGGAWQGGRPSSPPGGWLLTAPTLRSTLWMRLCELSTSSLDSTSFSTACVGQQRAGGRPHPLLLGWARPGRIERHAGQRAGPRTHQDHAVLAPDAQRRAAAGNTGRGREFCARPAPRVMQVPI